MALQRADRLDKIAPHAQLDHDVRLFASEGAHRPGRGVHFAPDVDAQRGGRSLARLRHRVLGDLQQLSRRRQEAPTGAGGPDAAAPALEQGPEPVFEARDALGQRLCRKLLDPAVLDQLAVAMPARTPTESLYQHAGGEEGLHRLEQIFYDSVLRNSHATTDDELHPLRDVPRWTWAGDKPEG